jgi:hypothetical protein
VDGSQMKAVNELAAHRTGIVGRCLEHLQYLMFLCLIDLGHERVIIDFRQSGYQGHDGVGKALEFRKEWK